MRNLILKYFFFNLLIILVLSFSVINAQEKIYNHPELEWKSFETEHFVVHFHQGTFRTANIIGKVAEDIYEPVTSLYNYKPKDKVHFIVKDTDDYSNGGAYFFDNKVEIWAENLDYIMRGTRNWLRDVVTHEYVHMIQIGSSIKFSQTFPYGFFQVFGYESEKRKDVVRGFPNTVVSYPISSINIPVWFAEGVAQHQANGARYDYRDPNREMVIRDRVINDRMLTFEDMGVFGKTSLGNESAYNLGYSFVNYLCEVYGEEVLRKITDYNAKISTFTFESSLQHATGKSAESLYEDWKKSLEEQYKYKLRKIIPNKVQGEAIELEGFANLYPTWSPDGKKIAYISNKGNDYFSQNKLIVYDTVTKEKKVVAGKISSSISWSPNGKYIAFSRKEQFYQTRSTYNDLFLYDLNNEEEFRITKQMRAKNPDWSSDGSKLTFVTETNGLNQLFIMDVDTNFHLDTWMIHSIDIETGSLLKNLKYSKNIRPVYVRSSNLDQVLSFGNGRQIYHPRWSPDDSKLIFDTAVDYGRNIAEYDIKKKNYSILLSGKEELRYPIYHPTENAIYYSSAKSGIYNIYKTNLDNNETTILTNVTGGALMPSINKNSEIVYSAYDSLGFHIYTIQNHIKIDLGNTIYEQNYLATIPDKNFDDSKIIDREIKDYKQSFTGVKILPRILVDYKTIKPGFYLYSTDVLNKMNLLGGAAVNSDWDYDLFGMFEYNEFMPTLFLEAYNMSSNISDTVLVKGGPNNYEILDRDVNFDLTEIQFGISGSVLDLMHVRLAYIISFYNARLKWFDTFYNQIFTFHYRYFNGRALQLSLSSDQIKRTRHSAINPTSGRYLFFRYAYEENDFLQAFEYAPLGIEEIFKRFNFHKIEMDWEEYIENPVFSNHALSLRLRAGYIDRKVDDFFHLFTGGLLGMKGYSYFSIEGTKKLIGSATYRFPLFNDIDWKIFNIYFNKLYFGVYFDFGNAWVNDEIDFSDFKKDIGFQLRLETFSNYLFPTRFFLEAAYPLNEVTNQDVVYQKNWRYYFGVLFEFDLRERFGKMLRAF